MTRDVVDKAFDVIRTSDLVMLQHEIPMDTIGYIIDRCYRKGSGHAESGSLYGYSGRLD